jgi:hypothetical protein
VAQLRMMALVPARAGGLCFAHAGGHVVVVPDGYGFALG